MKKIGFIGIGNMGAAMAMRIAESKENIVYVYDINQEKYSKFEEKGIITTSSAEKLVEEVDYIVLSVKPQFYKTIAMKIKPIININQVIITVAPSVTIGQMKEWLGINVKVVRTMPNTPALIGSGVTAISYNEEEITKENIKEITMLFEKFGDVYNVLESQMEAVVAVSGSAPAYGYIFIEAMGDAAVREGLPRELAYEMAAKTIKGACEMILETKKHPAMLKDEVTSPGGTTIEAVAELEKTGFRNSIISAMKVCCEKAHKMRG
ncbi:MAG: pyrroline-5-carboxylate reductase [Cellulosilyticaceae bacterium]